MEKNTLKRPDHPQPGFYYHYKHQPHMPVGEYAYEVMNVGFHTESGECLVVYRPLYIASVYKSGRMFDIRPLHTADKKGFMDLENGTTVRFMPVTDPEITAQLEAIKNEMYQ